MNNYGPYSFSRIQTHKDCPAKFKYAYIDKLPRTRPPHPAMERGSDIHGSVDRYILGECDDVHLDVFGYLDFFKQLRELGSKPELPFAVKRDWSPCDYDDPQAYIRGFIDNFLEMANPMIYEWKTGKVYDTHTSQVNLYATCKMVEYESERIDAMIVYFDQKPSYLRNPRVIEYPQAMLPTYRAMWDGEIRRIEEDETFMPNPTWKCNNCDYSKAHGGPCPF